MSDRELVVHADEVEVFVTPGSVGIYESQCLIDRDGVGSESLNVNRGTLKAGRKLGGGSHPVGADECYYVLRGRAKLLLGGDPKTGEGGRHYEIGPDTAVFIPGGTFHALDNPYDEDLVILAIWPQHPRPGDSGMFEARIEAWGTSFRRKASHSGVEAGMA